jgi:hypothetical protein
MTTMLVLMMVAIKNMVATTTRLNVTTTMLALMTLVIRTLDVNTKK